MDDSNLGPLRNPPPPVEGRVDAPPWMRKTALWLFLAVVGCMAVVHQPTTGWNVNTRLALVFAVVDQQTFVIDDYHATPHLDTGDKAYYDGHYYSDKIFGVSLLAVPVYAFMQWIAFLFSATWPFQLVNYVLRLICVSFPAALSVMLMWMLMVRIGAPPRRALAAVAFTFFGSMWFGFSLIFMPYSPGIAAVLGALYLIFFPPRSRIRWYTGALIGLLLGFAMICDLIFGLIVAAVGIIFILRIIDQTGFMGMRAFAEMKGPRTIYRRGAAIVLVTMIAGALPLLLFALYSWSIFGEPSIPYKYEADELFRTEMAKGFMGIHAPNITSTWFLTLHPFRGIFFWYPWLVAALAGLVIAARSAGKRRIFGWLGLWSFVAYLIFNSGYYMWWGGWAMGPRLMLPMFAAVPLGLAIAARRDMHKALWPVVCVLGTIAILLNVPLALIDPQTPLGLQYYEIVSAQIGDSLFVSQFEFLNAFYRLRWLVRPDVSIWLKLSFIAAPIIAAFGFFMAARKCPPKHLPFERLELPFVNYDGTAAPPPIRARSDA